MNEKQQRRWYLKQQQKQRKLGIFLTAREKFKAWLKGKKKP